MDKQKDKAQTHKKMAQTDKKKAASKKKKASTIKKKAASKKKKMSTKKTVHESTLVKYAHHAIAIYIEIMPYVFYGQEEIKKVAASTKSSTRFKPGAHVKAKATQFGRTWAESVYHEDWKIAWVYGQIVAACVIKAKGRHSQKTAVKGWTVKFVNDKNKYEMRQKELRLCAGTHKQ